MAVERVVEGDCIEYMRSLPGESVDLVLTDPPYGMAYQSNHRVASPKFAAIENDETFNAAWQLEWMREAYRVLRADRHFYCFCSDHHLGEFRSTASAAGFNVKRTLVWVKDASGMGDLQGDYAPFTEFVVFAHKGRRPLMAGRPGNVIEARRVSPGEMRHPTEKPIRVLRPLVTNSTLPGEVVLDPFGGSGSTGVVCREEGRGFILIERNASYVDVTNARLAQGVLC